VEAARPLWLIWLAYVLVHGGYTLLSRYPRGRWLLDQLGTWISGSF
jgi:hypothetical protein